MKRTGQRIAVVMVLCLALAMLSGCEKDNDHDLALKRPTAIAIWRDDNGAQQENFENMIPEFNEAAARIGNGEDHGALLAEYVSDAAPDAWYAVRIFRPL